MNVLFVSNDPKIFDPESAVRSRMRSYAEAIGTLHIVSRGPAHAEAIIREELPGEKTLVLHRLPGSKASMLLNAPKFIRAIIQQEQIEIVSAQDPFEYGWIASEAVKGTSAKLHLQVHTDFLSPGFTHGFSRMAFLNRARVFIAGRVLPLAAGIRVVSIRVRNRMLAHYGKSIVRPSIIPIAIGVVEDSEAVPFPPHDFSFTILAVSRLEEEKRIQDIIRALTGVHVVYPKVGLFIVGEGRQRVALQKLVADLELQNNVVFLGSRPDVDGLMKSADVFVQASSYEGYGLTLIEAARARLAIITTDVGVVGEVLKKGEDVVVVPFANPTSMAHEIVELIENPAERAALGEHARHSVQTYLQMNPSSPAEIAKDLEALKMV